MINNYDPIAANYDFLSRLIFRQNLILSQTCLLQHIPPNCNILIVGGGTGWILEETAKIHSSGLSITYVEISEKMIGLAKKRDLKQNEAYFINIAIEDFITPNQFDIVLTTYLFDNFNEKKAILVFQKLASLLKEKGKWLFADFHIDKESKNWQKLLLKLMFRFFRIICDIEARELIPMDSKFTENGFREIYSYSRFYNFLKSSVYIRLSV
ncbi:bifunctional 2-polyprenyl-6-hydroxyphenol methylase/3-demethylubiquinol 3-O-methyltransferase UbiG [Dyadobacter sp. NIV53]|uniref:class I SAM-dependent methyltransferase n=1 Tax=Dyadobacter sp. NIV53 TaxID=2861765 RepID=UPI001C86F7AA|nr:methyltransferase domain-containing protein [Dyadobacter sp. NIV53]